MCRMGSSRDGAGLERCQLAESVKERSQSTSSEVSHPRDEHVLVKLLD